MITLQLTGTTLYAKNSDGGSITGMAPTPPSIKGDMPLVELTGPGCRGHFKFGVLPRTHVARKLARSAFGVLLRCLKNVGQVYHNIPCRRGRPQDCCKCAGSI
jgi:hypothetical protein